MSGHFFFVSETPSYRGDQNFVAVGNFCACTTKPSVNPYFGGDAIDQNDTRSLQELQKLDNVSGLWMKEGGATKVSINPKHLFATREEAEQHVKLVELGTARGLQYYEKREYWLQ
jgi:hypothetical protein